MKLPLEAARVAAWTTACLDGHVAPDDLADSAVAPGQVHRVVGLVGDEGDHADSAVSLPLAVAELRRRGARRAWLVWPAPGDPTGLPGPAEVNRIALEAGQAVLVEGAEDGSGSFALVPSRLGSSGVLWTVLGVDDVRSAATSLSEADRQLKAAIRDSTDALDVLDVGRTRPEDEGRIEALRNRPAPLDVPPGFPARGRVVLDTTQRLAVLLDVAAQDEGGAISRVEVDARRAVLRDLHRTVRHAFTAAVNALAEEGVRAR